MEATTRTTVRFSSQAFPVPCAECGYNRARVAHLFTTDGRDIGATVVCPDCDPVVERPIPARSAAGNANRGPNGLVHRRQPPVRAVSGSVPE